MGYVIQGILSGLTPAEKWFLLTHPHLVFTIKEDADKALAESKRRFAGPGLHNGDGDAFRHCYWSALLSRDIGEDNARAFSTAHENFSGNPARERAMDLHNNNVGIRIGQNNSTASDAELVRLVIVAQTAGELLTAPPVVGRPYGY